MYNIKCRTGTLPLPQTLICHPKTIRPNPDPNAEVKVQLTGIDPNSGSSDFIFVELLYPAFFSPTSRQSINITRNGQLIQIESFSSAFVKNAHVGDMQIDFLEGLYFLRKLVFQDCNINRIDPGTFRDMSYLTDLYMTGNNISLIVEGTFTGLTNLKRLNLEGNHINKVENRTFQLPNLEELYLGGNVIESLDPNLFAYLSELKILRLNSNWIANFPPNIFSKLLSINQIDLSDNRDTVLDNIFDDLPTVPSSITVGLMTVVCLPPNVYSKTSVYPTTDLVYCKDSEPNSQKEKCPDKTRTCSTNLKVCSNNKECNMARFKGTFNYCSQDGLCICGEYLTGAFCNIPSASVIAVVSSKYFHYYNIPLFPGSLRVNVPPTTEEM